MKTTIIYFALVLLCTASLFSQKLTEDQVPASVKAAFSEKFPKIAVGTWSMEGNKEYEAAFRLDELKCTASFDLNANWIETECLINVAWLPKEVTDVVSKQFAGYVVKVAEQITSPKGTEYELSLLKGTDKKSVVISDKGIVQKKEVEKDEEDKK